MYCYTRYIVKSLAIPALLILCTLTSIIWLTQALRFTDLIVNRGLDFSTFLYLSILLVPSLVMVVLPVSLFSAVIFVYNKLIMDSELIVLKGAGLSKLSLAKPALIVAVGATLIGYAISLYLLPASYREFKDMQAFIRNNYASLLLQEGVFSSPVEGLTVYIQERQANGMLKGILVHDGRIPGKPVTMMAQQGELLQTSKGPRFDLINGNRQEINHQQGQLSLLYFDHYSLDLSMYTNTKEQRWREPQERYINELFYPGAGDRPAMFGKLRAEGHQRITWPLYNLVLTVVALAALFSGSFNRRGQWKRILVATCVATTVVIIGVALNNIVATSSNLSPLMYINIVLVFGGGFYLLLSPSFSLFKMFSKKTTMDKAVQPTP